MKMTSIKLLTTILISTFLINSPLFAGVYKWTDEHGKIHFSDRPHIDADEIKIQASKPSGIGTSNNQLKRQKELLLDFQNKRLGKKKAQQEKEKRHAISSQKCNRLKNVILNYEEVDFIFTRNAAGKKQRLSSKQKREETARMQKEYDAQCSED